MKLVVSERAERDLDDIYDYLFALNPEAARLQTAGINEKFNQLTRFLFIGRERSLFGRGVRSIASGTKVIFYVIEEKSNSSHPCSRWPDGPRQGIAGDRVNLPTFIPLDGELRDGRHTFIVRVYYEDTDFPDLTLS